MEAAAAMDFHALSRRELQALCKRNGVRANMTNAAMAEALQGLSSVDGIDEIGTTLCLPTPGRSVMKSAAKMAEMAEEEQQHGSPLPRGRRVSVKSPEAIRMEIEEGEDEMKRDLVKEIVKTPGVALRSTSRRARATPAPLPTPVPASSARATARRAAARKIEEIAPTLSTLRRSQRTAARKGAGTVEVDQSAEDVSAVKRTTRSARSKVAVALDKEDNVAAAASKEGKVLQEERKAVASDVKCDDPEDGEVTKLLDGDNKEEEPEEGDEADSSHAAIRYAVVLDENCDGPMLEEVAAVMEMEEQSTKPHEEIVEEQEPISVEKSAPLTVMDDSPILGVLSKVEAAVPAIEKEEIVAVDEEAIKENEFSVTGETDPTPDEILPAAVEYDTREDDSLMEAKEVASDEVLQAELVDDGTSEEDGFTEVKEGAVDEMPQAELADDGTNEDDGFTEVKERNIDEMPQAELVDAETSEEDEDDGFTGVKEGAEHEVPQAELADDETSDDDTTELKEGAAVNMLQSGQTEDETSEEDDLDEDEEWESDYGNSAEEIGSSIQSNEEIDETYESYTAAVAKPTVLAVEDDEDASTEDDDFSSDLPPEFDNIVIYSDAETESDIAPPVLEENQAAKAEQQDFPEESDATEKAMKEVDNIVKSLDEFTFKEGEAKEMKQPQVEKYNDMSLRKLKITLKNRLIALKEANEEVTEGKRLPLEEVDDNARVDC